MTKIKFTENDFIESGLLAEAIKKIDQIDANYVNVITDEMFELQPFFLSVYLGYSLDVNIYELEEIMKIYFLVWEYFQLNSNVRTKKVTESFFEKKHKKNVELLEYCTGEPNEVDVIETYTLDMLNIKSKSLLAAVYFRFNNNPTLLKMNIRMKISVIIGIKSFIECFETI